MTISRTELISDNSGNFLLFEPMADITAYELSLIVPILIESAKSLTPMSYGKLSIRAELIQGLPDERAKRHFK